MTKSTDYHDYVFKDGKFIGDFESMYRNSDTTPWHQDEQSDWIDVRLTKEFLSDKGLFNRICDLGCDTGDYLDLLAKSFLKSEGVCVGFDISETACQLAQSKFSNYEFKTINLIKNDPEFSTTLKYKNSDHTLWAIRGTLWYLVEKLPLVVSNLSKLVTVNDFLLVVQNFPPVESNFFGKNIMPDYHSLINHFSNEFILERHIWYTDYSKNTNDNWFIGLFTLKEDV